MSADSGFELTDKHSSTNADFLNTDTLEMIINQPKTVDNMDVMHIRDNTSIVGHVVSGRKLQVLLSPL